MTAVGPRQPDDHEMLSFAFPARDLLDDADKKPR
jgi:hypothetical protein